MKAANKLIRLISYYVLTRVWAVNSFVLDVEGRQCAGSHNPVQSVNGVSVVRASVGLSQDGLDERLHRRVVQRDDLLHVLDHPGGEDEGERHDEAAESGVEHVAGEDRVWWRPAIRDIKTRLLVHFLHGSIIF